MSYASVRIILRERHTLQNHGLRDRKIAFGDFQGRNLIFYETIGRDSVRLTCKELAGKVLGEVGVSDSTEMSSSETQKEKREEPVQEARLPPEPDPVHVFAERWLNADQRCDAWRSCDDICADYKRVKTLGFGRYGRTFLAAHRRTGTRVALKVCSLRRLARPVGSLLGTANRDCQLEDPRFDYSIVTNRVRRMRLEKVIVRCLSGLSPFVAGMVEIEGKLATSVCDIALGELGFPAEHLVGNLGYIWFYWEKKALPITSETREVFNKMMVFVAAQVADALRFLHCCGVVHHDISSGNILQGRDGYVKLCDFGRAFVDMSRLGSGFSTPPRSVAEVNASNQRTPSLRGPPEEMYLHHLRQHSRHARIGQHGDLHQLGYTLRTLDWPLDMSKMNYLDVVCNPKLTSSFPLFLESYCIPRVTHTITGSLVDYIEQLTRNVPEQRLGFENPEALIRHEVFKNIDFDLLRKKQLPAPMDDHLRALLADDLSVMNFGAASSPWLKDTAEKRFCLKIDIADKKYVQNIYENS